LTSSPTKRSRNLIDWSEVPTMPQVDEVNNDIHLVVNDEDVHLLASANKRRNSFESSETEVDSGFSKSNSPTDSNAPQGSVSGCSSMSEREISFEGYGEAEHSTENGTLSSETEPNSLPLVIGNRTNWLRSSLRRSDYNSPGKRVAGSNALASQLFKSVNHNNSSSRSSNGDNEDFCSDASLEDDVVDLGHKVQFLQQQISALADTQFSSDDRYSRTKQENAALNARLQMLEESLRDVELRAQQQLAEEQRRNKELIVRVEREKQLEIENCTIKLQGLEREIELTRDESSRLRSQTERLRGERSSLQQRLAEMESTLVESQEELHRLTELIKREREQWAVEHAASKQLTSELTKEVDMLRSALNSSSLQRQQLSGSITDGSSASVRIRELENEIKILKQDNHSLRDANDELQAQLFSRGLEEGRTLLNEHPATNSLAAEFEVMSQDDIRTALREQQEVNAQLRSYIEGILLTIVENQPSLLERKNP